MNQSKLPPPLLGPGSGQETTLPWRGIMLDSARTCHKPETILLLLELAARYGFNVFHWHLTDDQGWRFAVPGYERLTEIGGYLPRDQFLHYDCLAGNSGQEALKQAPGRWRNGFYTDQEIQQIVAHADRLGIEIIPEVDFPGHMMAAIKAYPEIGRPADLPLPTGSMRSHMYWPAMNDLLWPTEAAFNLVEAALRRLLALFPGQYIHIGGDECAYQQWESDPNLREYLAQQGRNSARDIQRIFTEFGIKILTDAGRIPVVWDDACDFVGPETVVTAWGQDRGIEHLRETNHQFCIADARTLYLNRVDPQRSGPQKGMIPPISVRDILTVQWDLANQARCLGIQTCLWSEFVLDQQDLLTMLLPRLLAVSMRLCEKNGLTGKKLADAEDLIAREYEQIIGPLNLNANPNIAIDNEIEGEPVCSER